MPEQWALLEQVCQKRGLVIFAGPMGSGKTTAMYQLAKAQKQQQVMNCKTLFNSERVIPRSAKRSMTP